VCLFFIFLKKKEEIGHDTFSWIVCYFEIIFEIEQNWSQGIGYWTKTKIFVPD
jgi:hypothetical protein